VRPAIAKTVSADEDWDTSPPDDLQFTDLTVAAGQTLTVPSGTVIRCTGTFRNDGTITVLVGAAGGKLTDQPLNTAKLQLRGAPANPGVSTGAAMSPDACDNTVFCSGGSGGIGLSMARAKMLVRPGLFGGGGGAGAHRSGEGGRGGGSLVVLARTAIVNAATGIINANGQVVDSDSNGGGAGGVVILASPGSVTNAGAINAVGGAGEDADADEGASGGGGGGIVHFLAPTVGGAGTVDVSGGAAGSTATQVTGALRSGGAGGGACGGNGGAGGNVPSGATVSSLAAGTGGTGYALTSLVDPTALF
jgi:hypothetical protein